MQTGQQNIEVILATLNAADVGSIDSILTKMAAVRLALVEMGREELVQAADAAVAALGRGDLAEFRRGRAFLQSKVGHLR